MKQNNSGFSLVEIVVAIAILGLFAVSTCTSLVLGLRMNGKTEAMLEAQLAVSSAVETLMAEGIDPNRINSENSQYTYSSSDVTITAIADATYPYYEIIVSSIDNSVSVTTHIRKAVP